MKLRNKKTGEIGELFVSGLSGEGIINFGVELKNEDTKLYRSLAELCEEWEDVGEEPKEWWYIDIAGEVKQGEGNVPEHLIAGMMQIGNYFETKEETEKAVKKLKAGKRLKDKGFRITLRGCKGYAWLQANWDDLQGDYSDVQLLFGGEE